MAQKSKQRSKPAAKSKPSSRAKGAKRKAAVAKKAKPVRKAAAKPKPKAAKKPIRKSPAAKPAKSAKPKPAAAKPAAPSAKSKPSAKSVARPVVTPAKAAPAPKAVAPIAKPAPRPAAPSKPKAAPLTIPAPTPAPVAKPAGKGAPRLHRVAARAEPPKAPPAEPTAPIDLAAIRDRLETKKREIVAMYLNDLRSGQESNDSPTEDIVDRANNAYSRELNFSISDTERNLLFQVEEAIARIDEGKFGRCTHCGQAIARPRLEAIPWARLCINCQELLEQGLLPEG